jgi:hypothetical protein
MIAITITAEVHDTVDPAPNTSIVFVSSNEPADGLGEGKQQGPDYVIGGPMEVNLRAERAGQGSGRVYTITVQSLTSPETSARKPRRWQCRTIRSKPELNSPGL